MNLTTMRSSRGRPSDEEVVVALEDHVPAPHPLPEPEGAGADRHGVHGVGPEDRGRRRRRASG